MFNVICTAIIAATILIISFFIVRPYLDTKNKMRDREIKNAKYELYSSLDPAYIEKNINDYIEGYIRRYITYKFISSKIEFIKDKDIEDMIIDITKLIVVQIPDLYIFYLGCLSSINNEEDLVTIIHNKVNNIAIEQVTNYNSATIL